MLAFQTASTFPRSPDSLRLVVRFLKVEGNDDKATNRSLPIQITPGVKLE
jgi:hypothetical protein